MLILMVLHFLTIVQTCLTGGEEKQAFKKKEFALTGPTNLQEAKSLQPPFGSWMHLKGKVEFT